MNDQLQKELKERYTAAVDSFVGKMKDDPNIIAVIVSGSLAYDMIWEKSDIDMTVIVRDQILKTDGYCIVEDGITINVYLMVRSQFKRGMERNLGGSLSLSYYTKGRIVYTTDDSLIEYFEELKSIGSDDIAVTMFNIACYLVGIYHKCQKWLLIRKDPLYCQYFVLKAVEVVAGMELCLLGEPNSREAIQRAIEINPGLINTFYADAMSHHLSEEELIEAIDRMDAYLMQHLDLIASPVIEFMADQQIKTSNMIAKHFRMEGHFVIDTLDYLVEKGVIEKVSQTIRITPKSRLAVEEIGFVYVP